MQQWHDEMSTTSSLVLIDADSFRDATCFDGGLDFIWFTEKQEAQLSVGIANHAWVHLEG